MRAHRYTHREHEILVLLGVEKGSLSTIRRFHLAAPHELVVRQLHRLRLRLRLVVGGDYKYMIDALIPREMKRVGNDPQNDP